MVSHPMTPSHVVAEPLQLLFELPGFCDLSVLGNAHIARPLICGTHVSEIRLCKVFFLFFLFSFFFLVSFFFHVSFFIFPIFFPFFFCERTAAMV